MIANVAYLQRCFAFVALAPLVPPGGSDHGVDGARQVGTRNGDRYAAGDRTRGQPHATANLSFCRRITL